MLLRMYTCCQDFGNHALMPLFSRLSFWRNQPLLFRRQKVPLTRNTEIHDFLSKIKQQETEDSQIINLNANENQMSRTARSMLSSRLSDRYNLGTANEHKYSEIVTIEDFTFKGLKHLYDLEESASSHVLDMFQSQQSEFRLLSGIHAMLCTIITFSEVGDTVYSVDYRAGGHFATSFVINRMGRISTPLPVKPDFSIDLDQLAKQIANKPPKMIYFDMGCPLSPVPLQEIRKIAGPEIIIVYDASHTLGLIAGGQFQDPIQEGADILQGNTHKTFPGPQKALITFRTKEHAQKLTEAMNSGLVSNRHNHHDLALFVTILEMKQFGKDYAKQMLLNAQSLANHLAEHDIDMFKQNGKYSQSHILLIKGDSVGGYINACRQLMQANICTNSRVGFGIEVLRIGVQEITRRGMKEKDMATLAKFFKKTLKDQVPADIIKNEVLEFNCQFNSIEYSFDNQLEERTIRSHQGSRLLTSSEQQSNLSR